MFLYPLKMSENQRSIEHWAKMGYYTTFKTKENGILETPLIYQSSTQNTIFLKTHFFHRR